MSSRFCRLNGALHVLTPVERAGVDDHRSPDEAAWWVQTAAADSPTVMRAAVLATAPLGLWKRASAEQRALLRQLDALLSATPKKSEATVLYGLGAQKHQCKTQ